VSRRLINHDHSINNEFSGYVRSHKKTLEFKAAESNGDVKFDADDKKYPAPARRRKRAQDALINIDTNRNQRRRFFSSPETGLTRRTFK